MSFWCLLCVVSKFHVGAESINKLSHRLQIYYMSIALDFPSDKEKHNSNIANILPVVAVWISRPRPESLQTLEIPLPGHHLLET